MIKYLTKLSLIFSLLILMSFSVIANDVVKVYDKGQDGGMRIYSVVCPNGKKTSVTKILSISGQDQNLQEQQTVELNINFKQEKSLQSTVENLKKKALRIIGQQNRAEMCLYPINSEKQCKSYKDVDDAAKAACDLTG